MAAYAALVTLMNLMDNIQNHHSLSSSLDKKQTQSLREKVGFLLDFIERGSHGGSKEAQVLERQIASAAYAAEDVIISHVEDQIYAGSISLLDLQTVIEGMDSVKENVVEDELIHLMERGFKDLQPTYSSHVPNSPTVPLASTRKSTMVGLDDELIQLMDVLTGHQSGLQIFPIVGMGGIGKTTLARNVYENPLILQHFDLRACVTISQNFSAIKVFSKLLSCLSIELDGESEEQLAQMLYQSLIGRRYLIILDDLWDIGVWDKIKFFFPNNDNRSRVIVTTRLSNVAIHFGSTNLSMKLLGEDNSWKLFCEKAFPKEGCPPELEEIGKNITKKCAGLPLLITVIGALLRKSSGTQEYWETVSKDINSIQGESEQRLDILSLSYTHLPAHLKSCFLYMGILSKGDDDDEVSIIIKLWIAEGFVKPNNTQSLEEVAEGYMKDLIDRNLISVCRLGSTGKVEMYNIHDLLSDCCLKIAQNKKFICVTSDCDISRGKENECRNVFDEGVLDKNIDDYQVIILQSLKTTSSLTHSLVGSKEAELSVKLKFMELVNLGDSDYCSLDDILKHSCYVHTPYLIIMSELCKFSLPISLLWNLQILIVGNDEIFVAPSEIWEMPQLRHVNFGCICLPDPPLSDQQDGDFVLRNLQTLEIVFNLRLSEEVCKRIPNVKQLQLEYDDFSACPSYDYCLYNLDRLHKLESLYCGFGKEPNRDELLQNLRFSSSLRYLTLEACYLHWEDLTMVGSLPHLEVLQLESDSVQGPEWNPVEGDFLRLKFLKIAQCEDLVSWNADSSHFPVLENLLLDGLGQLDEIPSGIGDITTLGAIKVKYCSESVAISGLKILEEQESFGNESLQLQIKFFSMAEEQRFREKVKEEFGSFTSNNLQIKPSFELKEGLQTPYRA